MVHGGQKATPNADVVVPRWNSTPSYNDGTQFLYDGSYIRLKNVELAYTWNKGWIRKLGLGNLKDLMSMAIIFGYGHVCPMTARQIFQELVI